MSEFLDALTSWPTLLLALAVFGVAPRLVLRLVVVAFHRDDPRREELLAELHAVPRIERPLWVAEQLEVAVVEGLGGRIQWALTGRVIHRWGLGSGVERNRQHPDSFWVPSEEEKDLLEPGDLVKLMFEFKRESGGERMWVRITEIRGDRFTGELDNMPVLIPKIMPGDKLKFHRENIIDVLFQDEHDENTDDGEDDLGDLRAGAS